MLKRIISRLDIKNQTLVKGINLEGLRSLGNPNYFAKKYYGLLEKKKNHSKFKIRNVLLASIN